jgi:hypothetical protein
VLAALCLVIGWTNYQGADTTGIELARSQGAPDAQIFLQQRNKPNSKAFEFDEALKAGYSQTEILNYLVQTHSSRMDGILAWPPATPVILTVGAAVLIWLIGRAFRYVLSGN